MNLLDQGFYLNKHVVTIAQDLLGKIVVTKVDDVYTSARIVETEAYDGINDQACHAFQGKRTPRNEAMYGIGGNAYIYLCYGIHHLFNVVTNNQDVPDAVLIRAGEPIDGIDHMLARTKKTKLDYSITKGPGNFAKALGITKDFSSSSLQTGIIQIYDDGYKVSADNIIITKRIGIDYAGDAIHYPYRFFIKNNPYVSGKKTYL